MRPAKRKPVKKFDWFPPSACQELASQLALVGPANCRLKVYRDAKGAMMLQVQRVDVEGKVAEATDDLPAINNSFICPPIC